MSAERPEAWRHERKFAVPELSRADVEALVRANPAGFSEIYAERWVDNLYLDSPDLAAYAESEAGVSENRRKVRIRWYGDLLGAIERPVLEIKIRRGLLIRKRLFPLAPITVDEDLDPRALRRMLLDADLPADVREDLAVQRPVLLNRYRRRYWRSADGLYRATLDSELGFVAVGQLGVEPRHRWDDETLILELKYARDADAGAARIAQGLPFRLTRSSKYVTGVQRVVLH